ncbi:MAG: CBS domain-containing protein [Burkholderiales bacterium]|nr:CBS domain-containing protein [Burkholderiales bacterium]
MRLLDVCIREVCTCDERTDANRLAALMRRAHVGSVVVVRADARGRPMPVGVVTDRDLVVEVLAEALDPAQVRAGDLIGERCITVGSAADPLAAIELMQQHGVRRLPVVDDAGALVGIVAADDLAALLAKEGLRLSQIGFRQRAAEIRTRT